MAAVEVDPQIDILSFAMTALRLGLPTSQAPSCLTGPRERVITLDEVTYHDEPRDCWIVLYDRVYDITKFLSQHPGGHDVLLEYGGRDATLAFRGTGHSRVAILMLDNYLIGQLPAHERIFRTPNGLRVSDIPE